MKRYQSQARNEHLQQNNWVKTCCLLKYFERVTLERRENVFEGFWELGDWTAQNAFLCGSVKVTAVKGRYAKKGEASLHLRRNYSPQYYINDNGMSQGLQKGFLGHLCYIQWQAFSCSIKNAKCGISTNRSKG